MIAGSGERRAVDVAVLGLQIFHVAFLLLHDWVPLGRLNDTRAVRRADPLPKLLLTTLISSAPFDTLLIVSWMDVGLPRYPLQLLVWLWIGYGLLFAGQLKAWWLPYFRGGDLVRVERYRAMFGDTYAFLPERNGIVPNALHVALHGATVALLILLFLA